MGKTPDGFRVSLKPYSKPALNLNKMNIKAERIEQLIQIVNRNLSLISSGQESDVTPLETRQLERVDVSIFGSDKFAYEIVHFLKSESISHNNTLAAFWERNFLKGLETLMVECAVVKDDIERDCFVSKIYCWYTEKLVERRDLPRGNLSNKSISELRENFNSMGAHHTSKGLDKLATKRSGQELPSPEQGSHDEQSHAQDFDHKSEALGASPSEMRHEINRGIRANGVPLYVKHNYPDVLKPRTPEWGRIGAKRDEAPPVPGRDDNYGMMHYQPESEAERNMLDLWVAKRREEAFNWKTQQHMALVMDRLAVHKSR